MGIKQLFFKQILLESQQRRLHDKTLFEEFNRIFPFHEISDCFEAALDGHISTNQITLLEKIKSFSANPTNIFCNKNTQKKFTAFTANTSHFLEFGADKFFNNGNQKFLSYQGDRQQLENIVKVMNNSYKNFVIQAKNSLWINIWKYLPLLILVLLISYLICILIRSSAIKFFDSIYSTNEKVIFLNRDTLTEKNNLNEIPNVIFNEYKNSDRYLAGARELSEIEGPHPMTIEMYEKYPEWAGYYAPLAVVHEVEQFDIDNDNSNEQVVYYSCVGCNAPARSIDILKNNRIIFTVEGGNLRLENVENEDKFHIFTTMIPRGTGDIKVTFEKTNTGEYHPVAEQEIYTNN